MNKPIFSLLLLLLLSGVINAKLQKVHRIDVFGSNVFLLETDTSLYMVDAGYPGFSEKILKKIAAINKKLQLIIITHGHFDHYGCAAKVRAATGAPVAIHEFDAREMCNGTTPLDSVNFFGFFGKHLLLPLGEKLFPPDTMCPDIVLHDNDSLDRYGLQARIVLTPGHTRGSCSIIVEDSVVFAGDLITNSPMFNRQEYYANSWSQIDSSVKKLSREQFSIMYIGHHAATLNKKTLLRIAARR